VVGGPGREFWVFGTNYTNDPDPKRLERGSMELGAWRIEVSPKTPAAEDLFLNVMQVTDRDSGARLPVRRLDRDDRVGCLIECPGNDRLVSFRRDGRRSGESVVLDVPAGGPCNALVADLEPGAWYVHREGEAKARRIEVSEDLGAAWYELDAGRWTLGR